MSQEPKPHPTLPPAAGNASCGNCKLFLPLSPARQPDPKGPKQGTCFLDPLAVGTSERHWCSHHRK